MPYPCMINLKALTWLLAVVLLAVAWLASADPACLPNCTTANLVDEDLRFANMADAKLQGATLVLANLARADLSGADLSFANLARADLEEADLSEQGRSAHGDEGSGVGDALVDSAW